jgi:AcrR family transcriptional regulator
LAAVKIDRLAKTLGVTRGGFYHHFENHDALLDYLLERWATSNGFLQETRSPKTKAEAFAEINKLVDRLIQEEAYSPAFDMAVREWARIDPEVRRIVEKVDDDRIKWLTELFTVLGFNSKEALMRGRMLYMHQVGFYSIGYHTRYGASERLRNKPAYLEIICGRPYAAAAKRRKAAKRA